MIGYRLHGCMPTFYFFGVAALSAVAPGDALQMVTTVSDNAADLETHILGEMTPARHGSATPKAGSQTIGHVTMTAEGHVAFEEESHKQGDASNTQGIVDITAVAKLARPAKTHKDLVDDHAFAADHASRRIMRRSEKQLAKTDLESIAGADASAHIHETHPSRTDEQLPPDLSGPTGTSLLNLLARADQTLIERCRSYLSGVSAGVMVLIVFVSFAFGTLFTVIIVKVIKPEPGPSNHGDQSASLMQFIGGSFSRGAVDESEDEDLDELVNKFDFEVHDSLVHKTRRWQWCNAKQIQQMGLLTQAPTKSYQGYKRLDVSATENAVETLLSEAKVDFTQFNMKRHAESVLWRMLRGEAFFMADGASKVLFMVETVRLRCVVGGRVLIQQRDRTFLGSATALPGIEKPGSESPAATARRMWLTIFKMAADTANFVEDSQDDRELVGYKGLLCVERRHTIDVKVTTQDHAILSKIGLPDKSDFSIADPQDEEAGAELVRKFKWMTTDQCKADGVVLGDFESASSIDLRNDPPGADKQDPQERLRKFLLGAGFDPGISWGHRGSAGSPEGNAKLAALTKELLTGKCLLTKNSQGLQRCVSVVAARLWSPNRKLMLVEKGRKVDSKEEWKAQLPAAKKDNNESLMDASLRICEQQLHFTEDDVEFPSESAWEYFEYTEESSRYTGILTTYQKFFVDIVLEDDEDLVKRVCLKDGGLIASETLA